MLGQHWGFIFGYIHSHTLPTTHLHNPEEKSKLGTYLKVGVDVLRDDVLRFGFVLAVDNVHVQSPLL